MGKFIVGLDLGQAADFSTLAVIEVVATKPLQLECRHLARYPLGTLYPAIVSDVATLLTTPPLMVQGRSPALIVDSTGVGRPVIDMFTAARLHPIAAIITGGDTTTHDGNYWRIPKRDLVAAVQAPLQSGLLKFADSLPLIEVLVKEMMDFRVKISANAHDSYGALWREGSHDDLIFSVMLACWWARRVGSGQPIRQATIKGRSGPPVMLRSQSLHRR
jgi:hypothetical protein